MSYRLTATEDNAARLRLTWTDPQGVEREREVSHKSALEFSERTLLAYRRPGFLKSEVARDLIAWLNANEDPWLHDVDNEEVVTTIELAAPGWIRDLPWELLNETAVTNNYSPERICANATSSLVPANRPLRVLFIAASPAFAEPVLNFEREEATILLAANSQIELIVEESGSIAGLRSILQAHPPDYFDVVHISGHAYLAPTGPFFVMEDNVGGRSDISAREMAAALRGHWPPLIFLSGCSTGEPDDAGLVASMAETLVRAGASNVLGWALPVGDEAAIGLAAHLYALLAEGETISTAVGLARADLRTRGSGDWHLLRLYCEEGGRGALVTPLQTLGRSTPMPPSRSSMFLDTTGRVRVADRESFVGRRRDLQALIRVMQATEQRSVGVLIHGLGGFGKSSLAARVVDRMSSASSRLAVWTGRIDAQLILDFAARISPIDTSCASDIATKLADTSRPLRDRLTEVFDQPLAQEPCYIIFDDFENGNLAVDEQGTFACAADARDVLQAFAHAIASTGSSSKILITSRYDFVLPDEIPLVHFPIGPLFGADLLKKLGQSASFGSSSELDPAIKTAAVEAASGIPRLIEQLDALNLIPNVDLRAVSNHIAVVEREYREGLLLAELIAWQSEKVRQALQAASIYDLALPMEALIAAAGSDRENALMAAVAAGLISAGYFPHAVTRRYLVPKVVRNSMSDSIAEMSRQVYREAVERGIEFLYALWVAGSAGERELVELFRLAEQIKDAEVLRTVGDELVTTLNLQSRFREALDLSGRSLRHQQGHRTLSLAGRARIELGEIEAAFEAYSRALASAREATDRLGEASILGNLASVWVFKGLPDRALDLYEEALEIFRQLGRIPGEAATLANIGHLYVETQSTETALSYYELALNKYRSIGDKQQEANVLGAIGGLLATRDPVKAESYLLAALPLAQQSTNRLAEAVLLNNLGLSLAARSQHEAARGCYLSALAIHQDLGSVSEAATTYRNLGRVAVEENDWNSALRYYSESLKINTEIGSVVGQLDTLNALGVINFELGQFSESQAMFKAALDNLGSGTSNAQERSIRFGYAAALRRTNQIVDAIRQLRIVLNLSEADSDPPASEIGGALRDLRMELLGS